MTWQISCPNCGKPVVISSAPAKPGEAYRCTHCDAEINRDEVRTEACA